MTPLPSLSGGDAGERLLTALREERACEAVRATLASLPVFLLSRETQVVVVEELARLDALAALRQRVASWNEGRPSDAYLDSLLERFGEPAC